MAKKRSYKVRADFFHMAGLLLAVLPAVRVGKQTAPAAFITVSNARQVLEMDGSFITDNY